MKSKCWLFYMSLICGALIYWGNVSKLRQTIKSLKYFLEQRISSPQQQKWVTKLFGYDYEIIYKKGKDNLVADALS
jgi:hypothetical protein